MIRERDTCRACGKSTLELVLDLGKTPLANDFIGPSEVAQYRTFLPLRLCVCRTCTLAQLADTVDPKILYARYAYVTSTSRTMDEHLTAQCRHLMEISGLPKGARVLEIASNTGAYLKKFQEQGWEVLGVEPAANISEVAVKAGVPTQTEFFNSATAKKIAAAWGRADLVVGRHVFAHIDDLRDLLCGLEAIAHPNSVVAFEVPYLIDFFNGTQFDTIYHEHLSYISVKALQALTAGSPFFVQRVDHYPIHGGSILFQLRNRESGVPAHASVAQAVLAEEKLKLGEAASWEPFVERVQSIRNELPKLIRRLRAEDKRVIGYGASAKGNTLLNTCGLTTKDLDYIIDNTPFKQDKIAPGSWLPIRPPDWLLRDRPDFALILAWNFAPEIIRREAEYQKSGGRFILPIPEPRMVEYSGASEEIA
jgi:novobiocin biosynthesis protein NovU/D-mycarose 3-C-methyltransferase